MTLLLASWLLSQVWSWDAVEGATSYRLYWGDLPMRWCASRYVEVAASSCDAEGCWLNMSEPVGGSVYFTVTALNAAGESRWEHGERVVCP
jgi:hypothetical protein